MPEKNVIGSKEFFNALSKKYDDFHKKDPAYMKIIEFIAWKTCKLKPERVLEMGVGSGNLAKMILDKCPSVKYIALDNSKGMLDVAKIKLSGHKNVELIEQNIQDFRGKGDFDCIVSNYTMHHLNNDDKKRFCTEAYYALKSGGVLIYGDIFVNRMGPKGDEMRTKDIIEIFTYRALYYLKHVGFEKMLHELEHIPPILKEENEIHVTTDFWKENLKKAGFSEIEIIKHFDEMPCDRVIIAKKP